MRTRPYELVTLHDTCKDSKIFTGYNSTTDILFLALTRPDHTPGVHKLTVATPLTCVLKLFV